MQNRVVAAADALAGLGIAAMTLAQPGASGNAPQKDFRLSELAKRRAELEVMQLEHDVDLAFVKKLMTDLRMFDERQALVSATLAAAEGKPARQDHAEQIRLASFELKFESLGVSLDPRDVDLARNILDGGKKEFVRKSIDLTTKRFELAEFEKNSAAAK